MTTKVPALLYDGGSIDVLWDYHEEAARWYENYLGWKVEQQEPWTPDGKATHGKMTHLGWGTWLVSYLTKKRLPFHFAERGTVDPNVRWCWKVKDVLSVHEYFKTSGIRVTDIYEGPGGFPYFDFWATYEGSRLTVHGDESCESNDFVPSWTRIGVSDLRKAAVWYQTYTGMELLSDREQDGYIMMKLGLNHHPEQYSIWILELLPQKAYRGKVDGTIRPSCWIASRESFFEYHRYLTECGIEVGEIGGFVKQGVVSFHFYDEDGNRFNISSM